MSNGKKRLHKKYRLRRTLLVMLFGAIILVSGIAIGSFINNPNIPLESGEKDLGTSGKVPDIAEISPANSTLDSTAPIIEEPIIVPPTATVTEEIGDDWALVLVNHANPLAEDFKVDLERVSGQYELDARVTDSFKQMIAAARFEGMSLKLYSAYRTPKEQEDLFQAELNRLIDGGADAESAYIEATKLIEPPWYSEYQTGLAVDICSPDSGLSRTFAGTPSYNWLEANAGKYGFILRYPEGKEQETGRAFIPYHFRYVGADVAKVIWKNGYSLEGYLYAKELESKAAATLVISGEEVDVGDGVEGNESENPLDETIVAK